MRCHPTREDGPVPLRISVLGPTRAFRDAVELELGGRRPAGILALLACADGRVVPAEALADQLWRGDPPATAATTLQGYVARLRRTLEPGVPGRDAGVLVTRGTGYALELPRDAVDAHRVVDLAAAARAEAAAGRPAAAMIRYTEALALYGGAPFDDVADVIDVRPTVARLEELRLAMIEESAEARLSLGDGAALVPELTPLAREHPLRERLQALLALALYQAGRQADALQVLRTAREVLADELGLDASPALRELQAAVLRHEPSLTAAAPAGAAVGAAVGTVPVPSIAEQRVAAAPPEGFVGRDDELAALAAAWATAAAGRGTAVAVTGEPGIGKSRLVEVFAEAAGAPVRWGRCVETGGAPPYWPWQQVLGGLPEAATGGAGSFSTDAADAGARFRFGHEVVRRLRAFAADGPLLVVLDDLQWADPDSLHVLEIVLAELPTLSAVVALTCRREATVEPAVARVLASMSRLDGARRLDLGGLAPEDVGRLAAALRIQAGGREPDPGSVALLAERSGGNPFFARELATLDAATEVPANVRDVLRLRLEALPAAAREVIAVAAVAGREVALALVAVALRRAIGELDGGVRAALRSGLLVEPSPGRLRAQHDLVREVVLADLGPARRSALHLGLAEALEAGPAAATSAAAIAVHRTQAAAGAPDRTAALACLRAATEALDRAGDGEAEELSALGLRHVAREDEELLADLHLARGAALRRLGRLEESGEALTIAADVARRRDDPVRLARAALTSAGGGIGGYWAAFGATAATDVRLLEDAADRAPSLPAPMRSGVLAALAVTRSSSGHDARDLADAAAETAGTLPSARARAAVAGFVSRWTPSQAPERVELARAMVAESEGDPAYQATALHLLRCALMETLCPAECDAVSRRFTELVTRRRDGDLMLLDTWWHSGLALARGDYAEARRLADDAVAAAPTASPAADDVTRVSRQTVEGIVAWHEHRLSDVVPQVVDLAATVDPDWLGVLAQAHAQAGRREAALEAVARFGRHPGGGAREPVRTVLTVDVHLELRDAERAAALLPALRAYGDTAVVLWPGTTFLGPAALYRGGVLALLGDPAAGAELDRAEEVCTAFGFEPFLARVRALREL
jgi:DNA-binding SARP family transcriptional activator